MFNKKMKQLAVAALSASMIFGAGAAAGSAASTEKESEQGSVSLSIAGQADEEASGDGQAEESATEGQEETETETQTETETETEKKDYAQLETTSSGDTSITTTDVSGVVEDAMPSIVAITGTSVQEVESYFYGKQEIQTEGAGSGIIIAQNDDELLIATNNHVVEGTTDLTVCFSVSADDTDTLLAPAVVKGTSASTDLAVIAVKLSDINEEVFKQLKIATLGSSDNLKVGEAAIVIGNALGTGQTVTTGIISALEREITTEAGTFNEIQTDAAINLGCSGGAILNAKGEVVGITDAKATDDYAESMGYGIPIDTAIPVLQELINRQTREVVENHGYLGITVVPVSDEAKEMYGMPAGAYVYQVTEGSAADEAGIKQGDIITKLDGVEIDSNQTLVDTLAYYAVGETVTVEIQTAEGGSYTTKEVEVTLQEGESASSSDEGSDTDGQSQSTPDLSQGDDNVQQMPGGSGFGDFFFGGNGNLW